MAEVIYGEVNDSGLVQRWLKDSGLSLSREPGPLAAARVPLPGALVTGEVVLLARDGRDLRRALRRLVPVDPSAPAAEAPAGEPDPGLTARERETLTLAAKGCSAQEVATMLGVSIHTVQTHFKNAYRKLGARSRGEAVFEAARLGLIAR